MPDHDPYSLLGLSPDAPDEAVRQAYRRRAALVHPDRQPAERKAWAEEQMRQLNAARDLLLDPARRRAYDRAAQPGPAGGAPYPDMWRDAAEDRRWRRTMRTWAVWTTILVALFGVAVLALVAPAALVGLTRFVLTLGRLILMVGSTLVVPVALSLLLAVLVHSFRGSR